MINLNTLQWWLYKYRSSLTFILVLAAIAALQWSERSSSDLVQATSDQLNLDTQTFPTPALTDLQNAAYAPVPTIRTPLALSEDRLNRIAAGDFEGVKSALLSESMLAVEDNDHQRLANSLAKIGLAALTGAATETDTALVYLYEALAIYEELEDMAGIANVNIHIGRAHIIDRRRARRAALAHDSTLLARWYIAHDRFDDAYPLLQQSVKENLSLRRDGAAAQGYETLYRELRDRGAINDAASAAREAAMLHASAGKLEQATAILNDLRNDGISYSELEKTRTSLSQLADRYADSVQQIGRARDYKQLYNHYLSEGDPVSAWRFRLKANSVLSQASKRARYRRQSGVLVLLYDSNDSMNMAEQALERAADIFTTMEANGTSENAHAGKPSASNLYQQATRLMQEIY